MDKIEGLLSYIRRTNPEMTREKLMEELRKSPYSSVSLLMIAENVKKRGCA